VSAQRGNNAAFVNGHYLVFGPAEKVFVKMLYQVLLHKVLQAEENHFVYAFQAAVARGEVAVNKRCVIGVLKQVTHFIKVGKQEWICIHD
jgi:hypothetical protein